MRVIPLDVSNLILCQAIDSCIKDIMERDRVPLVLALNGSPLLDNPLQGVTAYSPVFVKIYFHSSTRLLACGRTNTRNIFLSEVCWQDIGHY